MQALPPLMLGAVSMLSFVVALFFFRFWTRTRDEFFLLFSIAFLIDAASRFILGSAQLPDESEAFYYLPRLVMFCLIVIAIIRKNRPRSGS